MATIYQVRMEVRRELGQVLSAAVKGLTNVQDAAKHNFTPRQLDLIGHLILTIDELEGDLDRAEPFNEGDLVTEAA
jgi:hypothetical protein